jgi:hypothetical protein
VTPDTKIGAGVQLARTAGTVKYAVSKSKDSTRSIINSEHSVSEERNPVADSYVGAAAADSLQCSQRNSHTENETRLWGDLGEIWGEQISVTARGSAGCSASGCTARVPSSRPARGSSSAGSRAGSRSSTWRRSGPWWGCTCLGLGLGLGLGS